MYCSLFITVFSVLSVSNKALTPSPTSRPTSAPVNTGRCQSTNELDIIFIVDSSGSVYDSEYKNWENELNLVAEIVENVLPITSRAGLINFSGCGPSFTFEQCKEQNRLKKMISLGDYGSPNNLDQLLNRITAIGSDDFNGGYTWTNEALTIALNEFEANSTNTTNKMIVLITDGEPYPIMNVTKPIHAPCKSSIGYFSDTLLELRDELDVKIVTVGIDMVAGAKEEYFDCITDNDRANEFYFDTTFTSLAASGLSDTVGDFMCEELGSTRLSSPTANPTPAPTIVAAEEECDSTNELDIMFMVDSSGSVYDSEYKNWQTELDLVADIVSSLPVNSRAGLINFSGCGASFTFEQCQEANRLKKMISFTDYGLPNDLDAVLTRIEAIGSDDFNGGYTWTNEALTIALSEFTAISAESKEKVIVLITDGEPYPYDQGHNPCKSSTSYTSSTLKSLQELGVKIITIGIDLDSTLKEEYLDCITNDELSFAVDSFSSLSTLSTEISDVVCDISNGKTITMSPTSVIVPPPTTSAKTSSPTAAMGASLAPSVAPSPSPTVYGPRCQSLDDLDVIFMVDSSGSVYDDEYENWQNEINLVAEIVENVLPISSRVGLINFSGCGVQFTFEQCKEQNRLKKMIGLNDYGIPNDLDAVFTRIEAIGSDDFNGGYTWTNEALMIALNEFKANSTYDRNKMIVLITDGEPYPITNTSEPIHAPCKSSTGYFSDTLLELRNTLDVKIVTVGIDMVSAAKEEYFDCITDSDRAKDFYFDATWESLDAAGFMSDVVGDFMCQELGSTRLSVPTPIPTSSDASPAPTIDAAEEECDSTNELDIMFMIDSSGSVYDSEYKNWQTELDLVADIVSSLPVNSRAGLINFSGCGASFTFEQCQELNRLKKMISFTDYGSPNDLDAVLTRIEAIGSDDFNGGYTWTNEALTIALNEFNTNSDTYKHKIIVLITDGEPYPYDQGHNPCTSSTGYTSSTLKSLQELDVEIITIGIDIDTTLKEEYLDCITKDALSFEVDSFELLSTLSTRVSDIVCDVTDGKTITPLPTPSPTLDNDNNLTTMKPTLDNTDIAETLPISFAYNAFIGGYYIIFGVLISLFFV